MTELQHTSYYPFGGIIADISTGRSVQNRLYNGKEQDFVNNLFWLDYGARQYDPTRGQFTNPDPLAEKYYPWNYYAYCMNNPVKFIDPDGRAIYLAGSYEENKQIINILQQLTNDRLGFVAKTGEVVIMKNGKGKANEGKDYSVGTALVRELMASDKKMTIQMGTYSHESDTRRMDATNGKGTDTTVYYNNDAEIYVENNKGEQFVEKSHPLVNLGHELIHGYRSMKGIAKKTEEQGAYVWEKNNGNKYMVVEKLEEIETVGLAVSTCNFTENKIRKEHGFNKRIKYRTPAK